MIWRCAIDQAARPFPGLGTLTAPAPAVTVALVTLGCARNDVDSDQLGALLRREGYRIVTEAEDADVVLVNTCTFIDAASRESVDTILAACDLRERGTRVLVVGCMAERYRDQLAHELPEVDAVLGFGAYPRLPAILDDVLAGRPLPRFLGAAEAESALTLAYAPHAGSRRGYLPQDELDRIPLSGPRFPLRSPGADGEPRPWAYLKIASGCDRECTFCAIPSWRGAFRSRPLGELVEEARWLVQAGARELVLVSENTTSWGKDLAAPGGLAGRGLQPRLLEALCEVEGLERIRLMYLQPAELQRPLLEAMAGLDKVASYFDLSLQHASAAVLRRMGRRGSSQRFQRLVEDIRSLDPGAVFRSNFIVGFPGETDEEFAELAAFLEEARLDWVGLFAFSPQEGTPAARLDDQIPPEVAQERLSELMDLQEVVSDEAARRFLGRRLDVIVEDRDEEGWVGRSYREAPETDGEVRLLPAGDLPPGLDLPRPVITGEATLRVGDRVPVLVAASSGVDLLAVPERAPFRPRLRALPLVAADG